MRVEACYLAGSIFKQGEQGGHELSEEGGGRQHAGALGAHFDFEGEGEGGSRQGVDGA